MQEWGSESPGGEMGVEKGAVGSPPGLFASPQNEESLSPSLLAPAPSRSFLSRPSSAPPPHPRPSLLVLSSPTQHWKAFPPSPKPFQHPELGVTATSRGAIKKKNPVTWVPNLKTKDKNKALQNFESWKVVFLASTPKFSVMLPRLWGCESHSLMEEGGVSFSSCCLRRLPPGIRGTVGEGGIPVRHSGAGLWCWWGQQMLRGGPETDHL